MLDAVSKHEHFCFFDSSDIFLRKSPRKPPPLGYSLHVNSIFENSKGHMSGIKRVYPDSHTFESRPAYSAMIEQLVIDPGNRRGFKVTNSSSSHRRVWYAVLNHYGISYTTQTLKHDCVNGYTVDANGTIHLDSVCDHKPEGIYHENDWCQSTCDLSNLRPLDISTKTIVVRPYTLGTGRRPRHRIFCDRNAVHAEIGGALLPPITIQTYHIDFAMVNAMTPPALIKAP